MAEMLARFWLQRFGTVFVLVGLGLSAVELLQHGARSAAYGGVLVWSVVAASVAASLTTYWSYHHSCKRPSARRGEDVAG